MVLRISGLQFLGISVWQSHHSSSWGMVRVNCMSEVEDPKVRVAAWLGAKEIVTPNFEGGLNSAREQGIQACIKIHVSWDVLQAHRICLGKTFFFSGNAGNFHYLDLLGSQGGNRLSDNGIFGHPINHKNHWFSLDFHCNCGFLGAQSYRAWYVLFIDIKKWEQRFRWRQV